TSPPAGRGSPDPRIPWGRHGPEAERLWDRIPILSASRQDGNPVLQAAGKGHASCWHVLRGPVPGTWVVGRPAVPIKRCRMPDPDFAPQPPPPPAQPVATVQPPTYVTQPVVYQVAAPAPAAPAAAVTVEDTPADELRPLRIFSHSAIFCWW